MRSVVAVVVAGLLACVGVAPAGLQPTSRPTRSDTLRAQRLLPRAVDLPGFRHLSRRPSGPAPDDCSGLGVDLRIERLVQTGIASSPWWVKRESAGASIADSLVVIPQARVMRTPRDAASYFARVSPIVGRCMAADVAKKGLGFVVTAVRRRDVAGTAPMASGWRISYHTPARGRIAARFTVDYTFQCRGRACLLTIVAGAAAERGNTGPIASSVQKANAERLASVFP